MSHDKGTAFPLGTVLPASAETARVLTGEHGDFTRLVIELPASEGWTLGRTAQGYAFAAKGDLPPTYDLGQVWQRIDRRRLVALAVAQPSGALSLTWVAIATCFPSNISPASSSSTSSPVRPHRPRSSKGRSRGLAWPMQSRRTTTRARPMIGWPQRGPSVRAALPLPLPTGSISLNR